MNNYVKWFCKRSLSSAERLHIYISHSDSRAVAMGAYAYGSPHVHPHDLHQRNSLAAPARFVPSLFTSPVRPVPSTLRLISESPH